MFPFVENFQVNLFCIHIDFSLGFFLLKDEEQMILPKKFNSALCLHEITGI